MLLDVEVVYSEKGVTNSSLTVVSDTPKNITENIQDKQEDGEDDINIDDIWAVSL